MENNRSESDVSQNQLSDRGTHDLQATAPGIYKVIRRNGKVTGFDATKIQVAITKAFLAVEGKNAAASSSIHEEVNKITKQACIDDRNKARASKKGQYTYQPTTLVTLPTTSISTLKC